VVGWGIGAMGWGLLRGGACVPSSLEDNCRLTRRPSLGQSLDETAVDGVAGSLYSCRRTPPGGMSILLPARCVCNCRSWVLRYGRWLRLSIISFLLPFSSLIASSCCFLRSSRPSFWMSPTLNSSSRLERLVTMSVLCGILCFDLPGWGEECRLFMGDSVRRAWRNSPFLLYDSVYLML